MRVLIERRPTQPPEQTWHSRAVMEQGALAPSRAAADIAGLLPLWPEQLGDSSQSGRARLLQLLQRALRSERQRGNAGHWTYNLTRHARLQAVYRQELENFVAEFGVRPGGHNDQRSR